jgi:glycosyltransferase involved in cell wall biosynthesis
MTNQNKFSVVIPFYNAEKTISETIESVLNQSYKADQIIAVDDGSFDGGAEIVKSYQAKHKEIEYFYQPNSGVSSARNLGINKARNENIFFLDADDLWLCGKIELHKEHLEIHPECVSSFTNFFSFNENCGNLVSRNSYKNNSPLNSHNLSLDLSRINGSSSSVLGTRSILIESGGFDNSYKFGEDLDLWIRLASKNKICEIDQIAVAIRTSDNKLKGKEVARDWEVSKLYFKIWESNQIQIMDKKSRKSARKILRVDLRRSFLKPNKLLINYPMNFMKNNNDVFKRVFKNIFLYYVYLVTDTWSDFRRICKKG